LKKINLDQLDLIIYDFDGVMTNNLVYLSSDGIETVACNRSDGLAISIIKKYAIRQVIMSSEKNNVVKLRAKKLNIEVIHGIADKKKVLLEFCANNKYKLDRIVFIGNDLNDLEVMKLVAFPICPSDACDEIKFFSKYITKASGGNGVIREFLGFLKGNE
jgi:3-deoxy-D-manno-octulosonate 8-phosphate phosphatase (KDO 8-P phosphatase)